MLEQFNALAWPMPNDAPVEGEGVCVLLIAIRLILLRFPVSLTSRSRTSEKEERLVQV